jgi:hypothetical protein
MSEQNISKRAKKMQNNLAFFGSFSMQIKQKK